MLPRPQIIQLLSHASVFVCPAVYEPFGLINVEAMACEVPVVASATGGITEIVVDGETGYLVPFEAGGDASGSPRDPARFAQDLASRINELLEDPANARRTATPDAPGSSTVSTGPGSPRRPPGSTSNFRAPEPAPPAKKY